MPSSKDLVSTPIAQPTLTDCDREPIHRPERIQEGGILFCVDLETLLVTRVSANAGLLFQREPRELLEVPLSDVLSPAQVNRVRTFNATSYPLRVPLRLFDLTSGRGVFSCLAHRRGGQLILEFEPLPEDAGEEDPDSVLKRISLLAESGEDAASFAQLAVEEFRAISGYDRVMFYRFAADGSGEVIGEAKREDLESFLGLHYPASDIPAQARRLYLINPIRVISDVEGANPVILRRSDREEEGPLDLSFAHLRSVSPIHLEYLRNMGVRATMSVSLIHRSELEGLIACHHYTPRRVPYRRRVYSEYLGRTIAHRYFDLAAADRAQARERLTRRKQRLVEKMRREAGAGSFEQIVERCGGELLGLVEADGGALYWQGKVIPFGPSPTVEVLRRFFENTPGRIVETAHLKHAEWEVEATDFPFCGALFVPFDGGDGDGIAWFRREALREIAWAGYPQAKESGDPSVRLSPRQSFEKWTESMRGQSRPWESYEIAVAEVFGRQNLAMLVENFERCRTEERLLESAEELQRANYELQHFVHIASHDLQEPLRAVSGFLGILELRYGDSLPSEAAMLVEQARLGASRMSGMIEGLLAYARVGRPRSRRLTALEEVVGSAVTNLASAIEEAGATLAIGNLPQLPIDSDQLTIVVQNVIANAIKYRSAEPMVLEIESEEVTDGWIIRFHDNGIGIEPEFRERVFGLFERLHSSEAYSGSGIGLAQCRRIVEAHQGRIWVEDGKLGGIAVGLFLPLGES